MKFRPCIDLHSGVVKQIVGSTLTDVAADPSLSENFASELPASHYAAMVCIYRDSLDVARSTLESIILILKDSRHSFFLIPSYFVP